MDINRLFKNPFSAAHITHPKIFKFGEDHIQRLNANNVAADLADTITATTNLFDDFAAALSVEDKSFIRQQALTQTMNQTLVDFKNEIRREEGLVRSILGANSPAYKEFFPRGITEYNTAKLSNAEVLMSRFVATATDYVATLGQPFVDKFTQLQTTFVDARKAQLQQFGEVAEAKSATREKRQVLETQLVQNIYTLGMKYPANPDRGKDFFDMSILRRPKRVKNEAGEV